MWLHIRQNICKNVLEPREVEGSKTFLQMFYVTCNHSTVYLQAVFDPAKNVLQHLCKRFRVKHFENIL